MAWLAASSVLSVRRIWPVLGLAPHRARQLKRSLDDLMLELRDVGGPYLDRAINGVAPSLNEATRIQTLNCTRPSLPMVNGSSGAMQRNSMTNATTRQLVVPDVHDGTVIVPQHVRHYHQEITPQRN